MARVAFLQDTLIEYMGFMQMAAVLRDAGHQVEVFFDDQLHDDRLDRSIARFDPDVVGFSVLTPSRPWALRTAGRLRDRLDALMVVGNVDAIMSPEAYTGGPFDRICIGEGEFCLSELCAALDGDGSTEGISGFWDVVDGTVHRNDARAELVDMDELPPIDRSIYDKFPFFRTSPYLRVYGGRGCPFRCSFCANTQMTDIYGGKRYFRKRSPERFVADIERLVASRPNQIRRLYIIDEVLWFDRAWLHEFLELYAARVGITFSMNFKFNGGVTEDDIELIGRAGGEVFVAAETGDERIRRELLNKPVSNQHILTVTAWMRRHGVRFGSSAFFGLPGQTFEGHLAELPFYRAMGPRYLWTTFFQPYPGIDITANPDVTDAMPTAADYGATLHHEMYLDLPDRTRLVNLKKVYFLMYRFPRLERPLAALCRYRLPVVFDALFALHFLFFYALWAEGLSFRQLLTHLRNFAINPVLRRQQPLNSSGRPFDPGHAARPERAVDPRPPAQGIDLRPRAGAAAAPPHEHS